MFEVSVAFETNTLTLLRSSDANIPAYTGFFQFSLDASSQTDTV